MILRGCIGGPDTQYVHVGQAIHGGFMSVEMDYTDALVFNEHPEKAVAWFRDQILTRFIHFPPTH